jgi:hypothetical protein
LSGRALLIAALLAATAGAAAGSAVRHAGEWQTRSGAAAPRLSCYRTDQTFDEAYLLRVAARLRGASCRMASYSAAGPLTTWAMSCTVGGSPLTASGTVTDTGPDAYVSRTRTHGGAFKLLTGIALPIPDTDTTTVGRRLGPCRPGDKVVN